MRLITKLGLVIIFLFILSCSDTSENKLIIIEEINCILTQEEYSMINKIVDLEYKFYHSIFKEKYPIMRVKLFGDSLEYKEFQKNYTSDSRNGFYSKKENLAVVNKNSSFMKTIFHELNHVIMDCYIPASPKWINEGLSEYFEYANLKYGNIEIVKQSDRVARLKKWINKENKINLKDFFGLSNRDWLKNSIKPEQFFRTLSWGLVYFFMEDPVRKYVLKQVLIDLKKGKKSDTVVDKHYPGEIKQLKIDFRVFVDLKL